VPQSRPGRYAFPTRNRIKAAKPIARHYIDWAIPAPIFTVSSHKFFTELLGRRNEL
jgi:hypothetical protein